ncbi:MAG: PEGA domain-containing protein [Polyangiaceae bacterium]
MSRARSAFTQGIDLFDHGDFRGAARAFEVAEKARPNAVYLYNLGLAYEKLEDWQHAFDAMQAVLAAPGSLKPERLAHAKEVLAQARGALGELEVVCNVDGAKVEAQDGLVGSCPFKAPVTRMPGTLFLRVTARGHLPLSTAVELKAGEKRSVSIELEPTDKALAEVTLKSHVPHAEVLVDGVMIGPTPLASTIAITADEEHRLEVRRAGYQSASTGIKLRPGTSADVTLDPTPDPAVLASEGARLDLKVAQDGTTLLVDGQPTTSRMSATIVAGRHDVIVTRGGYEPWMADLDFEPRTTRTITLDLVPTPETRAALLDAAIARRTGGYILFAGGASVAIAGAALLGWNRTEAPDVEQERADFEANEREACRFTSNEAEKQACIARETEINKDEKRVQDVLVASPIILAGGVVAATVGLVVALTGDDPDKYRLKDPENYASVRLRIGPMGAAVEGTF